MPNKVNIQSVKKALGLLSLFTHNSPYLGITEMSKTSNIPKGTVHGLVRTLLGLGFLQQDSETRRYHLGLKIYELGAILAGSLEINAKATGPAYQLAKRTRLTSRIAIWDGDSALLTLNIDPRVHSLFVHQIGPRIPAYCSAVGKAILSFLPPKELTTYLDRTKLIPYSSKTTIHRKHLELELDKTRHRGYSIDREETMLGLACIGAPIFGRGGRLEASISLSGDSDRIRGREMERLARELLKTAREISRSMGYFPEALKV